ncbi:MAG: ATP-dependent helicase, partial [Deltaproteobacteria bacterium]|nr:ATP-dependent helicase [Deltaproteobacteria bacterium]
MSLTPSQTLAVRTIDRPLAVVAGAGSGKTLVLAERYRWLIEEAKVPVHRILAFTFTEKAAREIRERILNRKIIRPEDEGFLQIGTVHSFLSGLLRRYGSLLGLDPAFTILDEASARAERDVRIKSHLIGRLREKNPAVVEANERFGFWRLNQICQKLFQRTDLMVDPESFPSGDDEDIRLFKDAADLFHQWLDDKIKSASLTFDDLEILSFRLLKEHPEAADKIRRRFFHILVDEFQDTSPLQARIIEALVGPGMNTLGVKTLGVKTLFVVGDPGQSIYRFRRVETSIFKNRAEQIKKEGGQIVQLDESFRVPPRLAKIVNKVFIPLFNEEGVSTLYRPLVSVHHQTTGALKIVVAPEERLSIDRLRRLEAKWIAQNLKERNLSPKDRDSTALLFRASQPMLIYREELEKAGIPVQVTRTHNLLVEPEIRDLLHLLSYLAGDRNPIVRTALLRSSFFNLSEAFIERYSRGGSTDFTEPYTPDFFTAADDRHRWEHLRQLTARWEKLSRAIPPSRLFRIVVDDLGLATGGDSTQRLYVEQWLSLVDDIERAGPADLARLEETFSALRSVERGIEAFDPKNAPGCVKLMTIHSAKGREFDRVFLPQLYGGGRSDSADFLLDAEKRTGTVSLAFRKKSPEPVRGLKMELSESPLFRELKEV